MSIGGSYYSDVFDEKKQNEMRTFFIDVLAARGTVKSYDRNDVISPANPGDSFGIVVEGKVSKAMISVSGREKLLYFLRPGELFGEMNLMDGGSLNYVLYAKEPSSVSYVSRSILDEELCRNPDAYLYFIHSMTRKFRIVALQLANNVFNDSTGRVADALIRLSACSDTRDVDMTEGMITTALTQSELAYNVGCSRVTIARILKSFFDEGLLERANKKIVIKNMEGLAKYTDRVQ